MSEPVELDDDDRASIAWRMSISSHSDPNSVAPHAD
jgi:hypothetical protein